MSRWPSKPLGELCDVSIGRTPSRRNLAFWNGEIPWITVRELEGGVITETNEGITNEAVEIMPPIIPVGTLLFSFKLSIGKMAVTGQPMYSNEAIAALPIKEKNELSRDFLRYALTVQTVDTSAETAVMGKVLNKAKVKSIPIPVPPLEEQERIVGLLDEAEGLRQLRQQADQKTTQLIPALFHQMFGNPTTNPKGWEIARLGQVAEVYGGGTPSKKRKDFWDGDVPWVSPKDMRAFEISDSVDHITKEAIDNSATRLLPVQSTLIVTRSGILKHTVPIGLTSKPVSINQDLKAFVPNTRIVTPIFLARQLQFLEPQILSMVRVGATVQNLSTDNLKQMNVLCPPLDHQTEFANRVAEIREMEAAQAQSRARLDDAFQSLLHRAFNGEL